MPNVLFVCTANLYRSPLAEAFLREELRINSSGEDWVIGSAGTWTKAGTLIHSQTVEDANHFRLDVRSHHSRQVSKELLSKQDLVLVMEKGHKEALQIEFPDESKKIFLLSEVVDGRSYDIPDPFSLEGEHDREIADELHRIISRGSRKILALATSNSTQKANKTD